MGNEKLQLREFTTEIIGTWQRLDKTSLLKKVQQSLISSAISVNEWPASTCFNHPGIYCFWYIGELKSFSDFKEWYEINEGEKFKISKSYKKWYDAKDIPNIQISSKKIDARAFYLGKREELNKRITQHIGVKKGSEQTYGMHLNRIPEIYEDLYVGYWNIPQDVYKKLSSDEANGKHIIQQLITFIESELRHVLSPMVGKQ